MNEAEKYRISKTLIIDEPDYIVFTPEMWECAIQVTEVKNGRQ